MKISSAQVELMSNSSSSFSQSKHTEVRNHYAGPTKAQKVESLFSRLKELNGSDENLFGSDTHLTIKDQIKKVIVERLIKEFFGEEMVLKADGSRSKQAVFKNPYLDENRELKAVSYLYTFRQEHSETIDFKASVKFNTPAGSYDLDLDLLFTKRFVESSTQMFIVGDEKYVIDPLVVNFGEDVNPFDNLESTTFLFDLDSDGSDDLMPFVKKGAGYLALDKNKNGVIDSGKELFGPATGDGFRELRAYDDDKNGFIDENDEVFSMLKIWSINEDGTNSLISLGAANVGAIYLGDTESGFKFISGIDSVIAEQKSVGFFIKEDASGLGVINSLDIAI